MINPAAGAIVMAIGIFLYGAGDQFFPHGEWLAFGYLLLSIIIYAMILRQSFQKGFWKPFLNNPVNSFVTGSWIAGLSILSQVLLKYLPALDKVVVSIAVINSLCWCFFLFLCAYNFKELWQRPMFNNTHGVILLSTVATQSLVILWGKLISTPSLFLIYSAIFLGLLLYVSGLLLILIRYLKKSWTLVEDWTNTNCIIHGALSITGLAIVTTGVFTESFVLFFWLLVAALIVIVEGFEVVRAFSRVSAYGWKDGLFTYHVSQWSRNFTFGMFYAFTMIMLESPVYRTSFAEEQEVVQMIWGWVVLTALVWELVLWIHRAYMDQRRIPSS
ncbi:hypothetical protein SAMN05192559_106287 [Halobacillus karajensis]|uniref:Voltage-dependent anion channel n=2 Tax=Halobacillus karajensis TaxID=195088 RepID=A0A024P7A7_9BACI|nr:hypothetical protein BN982_03271 [Halobacillus karajensis]CDQ25024.1 hypothetical protein BN983_03326 [Halobacillus karajensis]CDQ28615.1 hypothetical protein BN981_02926 [Halobacillus karajensis]SEH98662.1 hypothetical protein SAMN05192559_106287 [Halobacillus karajensis]